MHSNEAVFLPLVTIRVQPVQIDRHGGNTVFGTWAAQCTQIKARQTHTAKKAFHEYLGGRWFQPPSSDYTGVSAGVKGRIECKSEPVSD